MLNRSSSSASGRQIHKVLDSDEALWQQIERSIVSEVGTMLDHIGIPVTDLARSKQFFTAALAPLGYKVMYELPTACGMTNGTHPTFWIGQGEIGSRMHIAFIAPDHATVEAFYSAAIAAGGHDHGKPGLRTQYHPEYYAAFVLDPDGNNIEVVYRTD